MDFIQKGFVGKNKSWMYLLTMVLIFIAIQLASIPLAIAAFFEVNGDMDAFMKGAASSFMDIGMNSNLFLFLMIFTFMIGIFALYLCVRFIHKKKFISIITSREKVDWSRIVYAFMLWGIISVVALFVGMYLSPEEYIWNFKPVPFFTLVFVSFVFLPFQTSSEELIFRGYLMQGFGLASIKKSFGFYLIYLVICVFLYVSINTYFGTIGMVNILLISSFGIVLYFLRDYKIIEKLTKTNFSKTQHKLLNRSFTPLLITSVTFGLLHGMNPEVEKLGYILMVFYIGTGLFYGITTLMDEGTELALGLHAANNIVAAFLVTTDWAVFRTDALYVDTSEASVGADMFIGVFVLYPILLWLFSKKYGWTNWKHKLFGKVAFPIIDKELIHKEY
jgi:membrane protease YdiL (CAAX protease family)